jgi:hypothetical protein
VTGNPGIGKSFFLIYLLIRFVILQKVIILQLAEKDRVFLFKPGQDPVVVDIPLADMAELEDTNTIFLHNPKANEEPVIVKAFTVLASSPNPNNYRGFCKRMRLACCCLNETIRPHTDVAVPVLYFCMRPSARTHACMKDGRTHACVNE